MKPFMKTVLYFSVPILTVLLSVMLYGNSAEKIIFASPASFLLIIPYFILVYRKMRHTADPFIFSDTNLLEPLTGTWKQKIYWLPDFLKTAAPILIIFAAADPKVETEKFKTEAGG